MRWMAGCPPLRRSPSLLVANFLLKRSVARVLQLVVWTGGGWREWKVLPVFWFDGLARILTKIENSGVWLKSVRVWSPSRFFKDQCSSFTHPMFGERHKALLRSIMVASGTDFFSYWSEEKLSHAAAVRVLMRNGHFLGDCTCPPVAEIRENREFRNLMCTDKSLWPRCLLWHGRLPLLFGINRGSPWAGSLEGGAGNLAEVSTGAYSSHVLLEWELSEDFAAEGAVGRLPANPNIWPDRGLVLDDVSGASSAGSGMYAQKPAWGHRKWGAS